MKGKKSKKRKISLPVIITILIHIIFITPTTLADPIYATFTPAPNTPPIILSTEIPNNDSTNINVQPTCTIDIIDIDRNLMTIYWYENSTGTWVLRQITSSVPDGSYQWTFAQATNYSTTYWWKVVVNDSFENTTAIFHFTTGPEPPLPPPPPPPPPPDNLPPVANITGPSVGYVNQTMIFYANESYDPDGNITGYRWDFNNDGLFDTDWETDVIIDHIFLFPGNYTIKLQVKDDENATAVAYHNITIISLEPSLMLPVAQANGPYYGFIYENITFNSTGCYDPDGTIVNYTWYFGDNQTSYLQNPIHAYQKAGNYTVILTVTDNDNLTNSSVTKAYIIVNETEEEEEEEPDEEDELRLYMLSIIFVLLCIIVTIIVMLHQRRKYKKSQTAKNEVSEPRFQNKNL